MITIEEERYQTILRFLNVSRNCYGWWGVVYENNGIRCFRKIVNKECRPIKDRKPIGQELLDTIANILDRDLTMDEESRFLDIKVIE